jgi:hypothetical protein
LSSPEIIITVTDAMNNTFVYGCDRNKDYVYTGGEINGTGIMIVVTVSSQE